MSVDGGATGHLATPPLPTSIWVLAYASVAGQLVSLVRQGGTDAEGGPLILSVLVGALVVGYVSAGVVRARTVRLVLAWVVLGLVAFFELAAVVLNDDVAESLRELPSFAVTVVSLVALWKFRQSDWYAWQRTKPPPLEGAPIVNLVVVGLFVGALGGVIEPSDAGPGEDGVNLRLQGAAHVR